MARRGKKGLASDLMEIAAALPWWAGVALAVAAYFVLHHFASAAPPATPPVPGELGPWIMGQWIRTGAGIGQYLLPVLLGAGALVSLLGRRRRLKLVAEVAVSNDGAALRAMSWRDFERLVGEAFRQQGYSVTETGGGGADGGIDLTLTRNGETFLVQCKHWKAFKVSVQVVRELYGVMAAQGAAGGFVVTSGVFTAEALAFAQGCSIELLDGPALKQMIDGAAIGDTVGDTNRDTSGATHTTMAPSTTAAAPTCPRCSAAMIQRTARQGGNAGRPFWGCTGFPQCRGIRAIS